MATILVTGGAGFIGSNFIHYMSKKYPSFRIINLDALTYAGNLANLKEIETNPNYTFVHQDIADKAALEKLFATEKIDYAVNFAAESHVDRSIETPEIFIRTNILGTQILLEQAKKYNFKNFVQVSTDEVYGSLGTEGFFTEDTSLAPNSPYSASKAGADFMVRAYYETFNLPVNITRCSNNYGPYQFPEKLIPLIITNALEDKELPVYGDGLNIRDWLHVKDHCRAVDAVLFQGRPGQVYNIGGNNEKSNIEIVKTLLSLLKKPESLIKYVKDRPGHDRRYAICATKIKRELGWEPEYSFETGLKETVSWYLKNTNWWKTIKSGEYRQYYQMMYEGR